MATLDFSKLKLEVYDFLGVILPGLIVICEAWVCLTGWQQFAISINHLSASAFTLLAVFAFAAGQIVQELGDLSIKLFRGKRFFRRSRDKFWATDEANAIKASIAKQTGVEIASVDGAFDYCLTKLKDRFAKRDIFIASSDLCRSLVVLSVIAIVPTVKVSLQDAVLNCRLVIHLVIELVLLIGIATLSWRRMVRFRDLSEATVFRSYLATLNE